VISNWLCSFTKKIFPAKAQSATPFLMALFALLRGNTLFLQKPMDALLKPNPVSSRSQNVDYDSVLSYLTDSTRVLSFSNLLPRVLSGQKQKQKAGALVRNRTERVPSGRYYPVHC
jgi:hypothetical protein